MRALVGLEHAARIVCVYGVGERPINQSIDRSIDVATTIDKTIHTHTTHQFQIEHLQGAIDFKEAAKALAEREKNRKWWEL